MRRSGSSLLMVVLIMTIAGVISVTGIKILLLNSRQAASQDASDRARQIARSGMDEALARLANPTSMTEWSEFGADAGSNSITALRRTFSGTRCDTMTVVASAGAPDCPAYDISIRSTFEVNTTRAADITSLNAQAFRPQDFPSGGPEKLIPLVNVRALTLAVNAGFVSASSYRICTDYAGTTCGGAQSGNIVINSGDNAKSLWLTLTYTDPGTNSLVTMSSGSGVTGNLLRIGKGYTTAEIIGYAGTAQAHYIIENRPTGSPAVIRETAQYYDAKGFLRP